MVTNLAQVNCKVLLKLALDHAPFPDLSVLHSTVVSGTDQGYIHCDNSISRLKKEIQKNSVRTHRSPAQQGNLQTNQSGILLFPRAKLKVVSESLLLRFRTVIGGLAWGLEKRLPSSTSCRDVQSIVVRFLVGCI